MPKRRQPAKKRSFSPTPAPVVRLALALILAIGLVYTVTRPSPAPLQIAEITNPSGSVKLSLSPAQASLAPNETTTLSIKYESPSDHLTAVALKLTYDPALLTASDVVVTDTLPTRLQAPKIQNGTITFAYGTDADSAGLQGNGTLATLQLKAGNTPGPATLSLSSETIVTTIEKPGSGNNALQEIVPTTLTITSPTTSTAPSTPASANPSAPASATPSTPASSSPSTSPSADPSLAPSPTSSPATIAPPPAPSNLRYNCYSNGNRITLRWDDVTGATSYDVIFDQSGGDNDKTATPTRPETDLDLTANSTYSWQVATVKDGVKSNYSSVSDVKCNGSSDNSSTPTPTPTSTPTPTPSPAPTKTTVVQKVTNLFKKTPSPSPKASIKPSMSPAPSFTPASPLSSPGNLADVFASPIASPDSRPSVEPNLLSKIFLGWQAIFLRFVESLGR